MLAALSHGLVGLRQFKSRSLCLLSSDETFRMALACLHLGWTKHLANVLFAQLWFIYIFLKISGEHPGGWWSCTFFFQPCSYQAGFAEGGGRLDPALQAAGPTGLGVGWRLQTRARGGTRTLLLRERSGRALQKLGIAAILQSERAGEEFVSLTQ